jgi:outer membrane protein, multidrug efflux system
VHLTTREVGVALLLTVGTACRMGPNYERPETTPVPTAWRDSAQVGRDSSFANVPWWGVFNDDTLQTLIRRALKENRDVHIALARVN